MENIEEGLDRLEKYLGMIEEERRNGQVGV
jgi:hypothetical protein